MRTKAAPRRRWTVDDVRRILARPMELVIDGAVAYWLEDASGRRLGPESGRSLQPLSRALGLTRAGRDPDTLLLCARLESGERYEIGGGQSLVGAAEAAAGVPAQAP